MATPRLVTRRSTRSRALVDRLAPMDRPAGIAVGVQTWRDFLCLHWPIPAEALQKHIPARLTIDRFDGKAYVSIVAFRAVDSRPTFAPRMLGMSWSQVNVRTYVHFEGKEPGIYILAADTDSLMASLGMRVGQGVPTRTSRIEYRHEDGQLSYVCERPSGAFFQTLCQLGGREGAAEPGTLDHFLLERYYLHVDRPASLWTVQIHHAPIDGERARVHELEDSLIAELGLPEREGTPIVHYAREVKTEMFVPGIRV